MDADAIIAAKRASGELPPAPVVAPPMGSREWFLMQGLGPTGQPLEDPGAPPAYPTPPPAPASTPTPPSAPALSRAQIVGAPPPPPKPITPPPMGSRAWFLSKGVGPNGLPLEDPSTAEVNPAGGPQSAPLIPGGGVNLAAIGLQPRGVDAISAASPAISSPAEDLPAVPPLIAAARGKAKIAPKVEAPKIAPTISAAGPEYELEGYRKSQYSQPKSLDWAAIGNFAKRAGIGILDAINAFGSGYSGQNYPTRLEQQLNREQELKKQQIQNDFAVKLADIQSENAMRQAAQAQGFNLETLTQDQANKLAQIAAQGDITKQTAYINWWGRMHQPGSAPSVANMYASTGTSKGSN